MNAPSVISFGGGRNSTALLLGWAERDLRPPTAILFADTGSEFPETYDHVAFMNRWCQAHLDVEVTTVHRGYHRHASLEHECHNLQTLPSKAFGYSGCSVKWKRQPMDRWVREQGWAQKTWERGAKICRIIGIHAGEQHRGKIPDDNRFTYAFPLIDWRWSDEECAAACARWGIPLPRKSACWFCPSSTKSEVIALAKERPGLFERAVAIEEVALAAGKLTKVKGLGRHWSWKDLVKSKHPELLPETGAGPCVSCWDPHDTVVSQADDDENKAP